MNGLNPQAIAVGGYFELSIAVVLPMPEVPPVTSTTLPENFLLFVHWVPFFV
jgi:hypothetical protein